MSNESTTKRFGWMKMKSKADPNPDPKLTGKGGVEVYILVGRKVGKNKVGE